MSNIFTKITSYMVNNRIIPAEDSAIYEYGLQQGFILLLNIITMLLLGLLNHMLLESILFIFAYCPLRTFAGGFHARTQLRCYLGGIALTQTVLLAIRFIPQQLPILLLLAAFAFVTIFVLAPVADSNKPLTVKETQVFRQKAHRLLFVVLMVAAILLLLHYMQAAAAIIISLDALSIMLLLGYPQRPAELE